MEVEVSAVWSRLQNQLQAHPPGQQQVTPNEEVERMRSDLAEKNSTLEGLHGVLQSVLFLFRSLLFFNPFSSNIPSPFSPSLFLSPSILSPKSFW